jgi:hypothetical protein
VANHLSRFPTAKMSDFEDLFKSILSREQIKYYVYNFVEKEMLIKKGTGRGTTYLLSDSSKKNPEVLGSIMELGLIEMKKRGELPSG